MLRASQVALTNVAAGLDDMHSTITQMAQTY